MKMLCALLMSMSFMLMPSGNIQELFDTDTCTALAEKFTQLDGLGVPIDQACDMGVTFTRIRETAIAMEPLLGKYNPQTRKLDLYPQDDTIKNVLQEIPIVFTQQYNYAVLIYYCRNLDVGQSDTLVIQRQK